MSVRPVAAIDLGTNSTNVLITNGDDVYRRITTVCRLGQDVHRTRRLDDGAIARTMAALTEYKAACAELEVDAIRIAATSACRDATNRDEFFDAVEALLGVRPELLAGEEEGRLAFGGSLRGLEVAHPVVVVDIGGGSTEIMLGSSDGALRFVQSIDVGALRLTEAELHSDPPRPEELTNAIGYVTDLFDDVIRECPEILDAATLVGIGGAINTVGRVELGQYDVELHGFTMERTTVEEIFRMLATEPLADRLHNPGLKADRADIIVGGMCAIVAIMRRLQVDSVTISRLGLMDGITQALFADRTRMGGSP